MQFKSVRRKTRLAAGRVALGGDFGDQRGRARSGESGLLELGDAGRARKRRRRAPGRTGPGHKRPAARAWRNRPGPCRSDRLGQQLGTALAVEKRAATAARGCARVGRPAPESRRHAPRPSQIQLGKRRDRQQPSALRDVLPPASASIGADPAFPPIVARASKGLGSQRFVRPLPTGPARRVRSPPPRASRGPPGGSRASRRSARLRSPQPAPAAPASRDPRSACRLRLAAASARASSALSSHRVRETVGGDRLLIDEREIVGRSPLADHLHDRALPVLGHTLALEQLHHRAVVER